MPLFDTVTDTLKGIAGIFDNGLDIYASAKAKIAALDKIGDETVSSVQQKQTELEKQLLTQTQSSQRTATLAIVAAIALGLILVLRKKK